MPRNMGRDDNIKVMVRMRPPGNPGEDTFFTVCAETATITVPTKNEPKSFSYDSVAGEEVTQDEVFSYSGRVLVDQCVSGYNGALFAYGQTGSGKTFTMMGPGFDETSESLEAASRGVIPRCLEYLFATINNEGVLTEDDLGSSKKTYLVKTTFLEIYNEQIYDLLEPGPRPLNLRESLQSGVFVDGLTEKTVGSPREAFESLMRGMANRRVATTTMNRESSRSHAVFTLHLESKEMKEGLLKVKKSLLHLIDLAGSERQKETKTDGIRLKEAGSINRSLATLGKVIMALVDVSKGKQRYIHYRDSKLTFMLRDSLGGNSKTFVIACIHPGARFCGESVSTLQFASQVKLIKNAAKVNEDVQGNVAKLKEEICHLRAELSRLASAEGPTREMAPVAAPEQAENAGKWRHFFLDSMALCKMQEGRLRGVSQQLRTANEATAQLEKLVQARDLVIRFRDSTIQRLTGKGPPKSDVNLTEAVQLRQEMDALAKLESGAPLKYLQENQRLRAALEEAKFHLKEESRYRQETASRLEEEFRLLVAEGAVEEGHSFLKESTSNKPEEQQAELVKTNQDLRCQLSEVEELRRKEKLELTSEITALKKTVEENERLRLSRLLRTNVERESLNDRHLRTIRNLTPTRPRSLGRVRNPSPSAIASPFGDSLGSGILEATPPQEATVAVVTLELREEQERSCQLSAELEKSQKAMAELQAEVAKVQFTAEQLQADLDAANLRLQRKRFELENAEEDLRFHESKAADTKVLLDSSDRELAAARSRLKAVEQENARVLELLGRTEHRLDSLSSELEEALGEKDVLQANNEELRTSLSVFESRANDLEREMERARSQLSAVSRQTVEERDNLELCLSEKASALEQALLACQGLESRLSQVERAREEDQKLLGQEIARLTSDRERLTQTLDDEASRSEEAAARCTQQAGLAADRLQRLQQLGAELQSSEAQRSRLEALLRDASGEVAGLQSDMQRSDAEAAVLRRALAGREQDITELRASLEQRDAQLLELKTSAERSDCTIPLEAARLHQELDSRDSRIHQLVETNASLESMICDKNEELQNLVQSLEDANRSRRSLEEDLRVSHQVCDESKTTMLSYRENMKRVTSYLSAKRLEFNQVVEEKNELEARLNAHIREKCYVENLLEKKEVDIARFQESLDDARALANRHQSECEKLQKASDERITELENEKEELLLLMPQAGHMNPKQKIHYIDRLRDEVLSLKQRNDGLSQEVLVLTGRLRKYEPASSRYLRESDRQNQP